MRLPLLLSLFVHLFVFSLVWQREADSNWTGVAWICDMTQANIRSALRSIVAIAAAAAERLVAFSSISCSQQSPTSRPFGEFNGNLSKSLGCCFSFWPALGATPAAACCPSHPPSVSSLGVSLCWMVQKSCRLFAFRLVCACMRQRVT